MLISGFLRNFWGNIKASQMYKAQVRNLGVKVPKKLWDVDKIEIEIFDINKRK